MFPDPLEGNLLFHAQAFSLFGIPVYVFIPLRFERPADRTPLPKEKSRNPTRVAAFQGSGAEEGTRTPTWQPTLDPESSASTNSATSAHDVSNNY